MIQISYLAGLCTYTPSLCVLRMELMPSIFLVWQPYLCFFSDQHIWDLILFRHFANEHCNMYCLSFMILPNELRSLWTYFWLIWHSCQWAYRIMICPSSVVVVRRRLCTVTLSRLLIIETSYFMHICTYVPSQSLAKIMLLWPLFSNWQPYLCFWLSVQTCPEYTIDHRDFIFYVHMHLCPISKPSKNYVAVTIILKLAAIFVFFLWTFLLDTQLMIQISYLAGLCTYTPSLCVLRIKLMPSIFLVWQPYLCFFSDQIFQIWSYLDTLPMSIVACIVLVLWYCQMSSGPSGPILALMPMSL